MNKPAIIKGVTWLCRLVVGGAFLFAGIVKIIAPATFATDISHYQILPANCVNALAITLPWIEVVAGLLLVGGIWMRPATLVIGILLLVFVVAIASAMHRGLNILCGCYGSSDAQPVGWRKLSEDFVFLAMVAWLWWQTKEQGENHETSNHLH
jgi:putative oxidoreductase